METRYKLRTKPKTKEIFFYRTTKFKERSINSSPFSNQKGVSLIIILSLLPFIITLALAITSSSQLILWKNRTQYICQKLLLNHQDQIRIAYQRIMKLNPRAQLLRARLYTAQIKLAAALAARHPQMIAKATRRIQRIVQQQKKLAKEQNLREAQARSILAQLNTQKKFQLKTQLGDKYKVTTGKYKYSLTKIPKNSRTPNFVTQKNFSTFQRVQSAWSVDLKYILPRWLALQSNTRLQGACAATQYRKGNKWYAGLSAVKRS